MKPIKIDLGDSPNTQEQINETSAPNETPIDQQKPTTLTTIGNKTIILPKHAVSSHQSKQPSIHNLDRDLSNADDDELRLSSYKPSR